MPARDRKAVSADRAVDLMTLPAEQAKDFLTSRLESNAKEGVLRLAKVPCVIIRPEAIVNIQKQLEGTIGGSSKGVVYLSGERGAWTGMNLFASIESSESTVPLAN